MNTDSLWKLQGELDSINLNKILLLIATYDCLSTDSLGKNSFTFIIDIVFLHNPDKMHDDNINKNVKNEIINANLSAWGFTAAYDRWLIAQDETVLYGAYGVQPCIEDLEKVNVARRELHMKEFLKENLKDCNE